MSKEKHFPVVEIFGPTLQGEGADQGMPCLFVRFGGCDYKCSWCDTPHAVIASEVREGADRLTKDEIKECLERLHPPPYKVILSGGNPAMHKLDQVCLDLKEVGYNVDVETQGSMWRDWFSVVDRLCVSPKPPSSGMTTNWDILKAFALRMRPESDFFKVVVFDTDDLEYAATVTEIAEINSIPMFLSAGNDAGRTVGQPDRVDSRSFSEVVRDLVTSSQGLAGAVLKDDRFKNVRVQSQYHVLLWGNEQGV